MISLTQVLPSFLPSQGKFRFLSETEEKVYKRFQRFPQAIVQAGEREEEEEPVDNPDVKEEGAEENVDQPSLQEPGQQEAQLGGLSLSLVSLLEDFRHVRRELVILTLAS